MASCGEDVDKMRVHFTTSPVPRKYTKYPVGITPRYISSLTPGRLAKFLPTAVGSWPSRFHPTRMVTLNLDLVSVRVISSRIGRTSTNQRTNTVNKKQLTEAKYKSEEICNWYGSARLLAQYWFLSVLLPISAREQWTSGANCSILTSVAIWIAGLRFFQIELQVSPLVRSQVLKSENTEVLLTLKLSVSFFKVCLHEI